MSSVDDSTSSRMASQAHRTGYHAILIGINWYPENSLQGAVRDVQELKAHLEMEIEAVNLHVLTATVDDLDPTKPVEDPEYLPTCSNIIRDFRAVTENARPGDRVYVHYSGHGTRDVKSGRLLLAVCGPYITSILLAACINTMVVKGLVVTLVMDCCFSASVQRGPRVRFISYDPALGEAAEIAQEEELRSWIGRSGIRDAKKSFEEFFIKDSKKHAILVACGDDEKACEVQLPDDSYHGKLSWFILNILKAENGLSGSLRDIFARLHFDFRYSSPPQRPVLYGNEGQTFFREASMSRTSHQNPLYFQVDKSENGRLTLWAGKAHGINDGDQFALLPSSSTAVLMPPNPIMARVCGNSSFRSNLEIPDPTSVETEDEWKATALSQLALRQLRLKLGANLRNKATWINCLHERYLEGFTEPHRNDFTFQVDLASSRFRVTDSRGQELLNIPNVEDSETSIIQMCDILRHLIRYQFVKDLCNLEPARDFDKSIEVYLSVQGKRSDETRIIPIKEGAKITMNITNELENDVYVSIYNLGPQWQIINVCRESYDKVPGRGRLNKSFTMKIPLIMKNNGHQECHDVLKVWVTSKPTSMYNLRLPKLNEFPGTDGSAVPSLMVVGFEESQYLFR
ncbi:unnamed protein product [Clonostachys solani]|uniref:Peptidase C14 caspase domain-containing protein n=1 Tax=Clonostachys solani TaxID=160281 RepID=A0A9N9ZJC2_9HYPO|nr:unnamed protein product [Clonostachys solani]